MPHMPVECSIIHTKGHIMEPETVEIGSRTSSPRSFNEIVCRSIDRTLEELLGPKALSTLYEYLGDKFGVGRDELPYRVDTISAVLENVFGIKGASVVEWKVAKNLYDEILLSFDDEQHLRLKDYITIAKETVSRDTYYV